jgi:hypothetical protein
MADLVDLRFEAAFREAGSAGIALNDPDLPSVPSFRI